MTQARFSLPDLPFARDALAPAISSATLAEHHGAHHANYVRKLNKLTGEHGMADRSLLEILRAKTVRDGDLFDNAAQHFNHSFYWQSLARDGRRPSGALLEMIVRDFGSLGDLRAEMVDVGAGHFGSGWVWLVKKGQKLHVIDTHDAETPVVHKGSLPLLVVDLWEHAYYLDYRSARKAHLDAVTKSHLNWAFAASLLARGELDDDMLGIANGKAQKAGKAV